jgi:hypothetical protein
MLKKNTAPLFKAQKIRPNCPRPLVFLKNYSMRASKKSYFCTVFQKSAAELCY